MLQFIPCEDTTCKYNDCKNEICMCSTPRHKVIDIPSQNLTFSACVAYERRETVENNNC